MAINKVVNHGSKSHSGMKNVIDQLHLNVPKGLDYVKYAKANYKMALGDTDFV